MNPKNDMIRFALSGDYIELIQLLKATNLAESGGAAKKMVDDGLVKLNDKVEYRKRAKLRKGDRIKTGSCLIVIE
ncbi:MAG TPA: RNA-binding S4 domain-containing protein [Bacteroidales bacterium]|nr:RNA-binding S4 domain-containing protein [Bacteroidales bacterium]